MPTRSGVASQQSKESAHGRCTQVHPRPPRRPIDAGAEDAMGPLRPRARPATRSLARGDLLHALARQTQLAADVLEGAAAAELLPDGRTKLRACLVGIGHRASVLVLSSLEFGLAAHAPPRPTGDRARSVRSR